MKIYIKYQVYSNEHQKSKKIVVICNTLEEAWRVYSDAKGRSDISYLRYSSCGRNIGFRYDKTPKEYFENPY